MARDDPLISVKWAKYEANPLIERSGVGAGMKLWIPLPRTRTRDTEKYIDTGYDESSKAQKDPEKAFKAEMLGTVDDYAASRSDAFLRDLTSSASEDPEGTKRKVEEIENQELDEDKLKKKKGRAVDVAFAAPAAYAKYAAPLANIEEQTTKMITTLQETLNSDARLKDDSVVIEDELLRSYVVTVKARLELVQMFNGSAPAQRIGITSGLVTPQSSKSNPQTPKRDGNDVEDKAAIEQGACDEENKEANDKEVSVAAVDTPTKMKASDGRKATRDMMAYFRAMGVQAPALTNPDHAMSLEAMKELRETIKEIVDPLDLEKATVELANAIASFKEMRDSASKAGACVIKRLRALTAESTIIVLCRNFS